MPADKNVAKFGKLLFLLSYPILRPRAPDMFRRELTNGALLTGLFLLSCVSAFPQQPKAAMAADGSTQGNLAVTLTVASSVGLVIVLDGEKRMIMANAVDLADNVSRLQPVRVMQFLPAAAKKNQQTPRQKQNSSPRDSEH